LRDALRLQAAADEGLARLAVVIVELAAGEDPRQRRVLAMRPDRGQDLLELAVRDEARVAHLRQLLVDRLLLGARQAGNYEPKCACTISISASASSSSSVMGLTIATWHAAMGSS